MRIRYIRIYSNGNSVNGYSHFVEVQAINKNGENVAYGRGLIEYSSCTGGSPDRVTDGDYSNALAYLNMDSGLQHIVIDLGSLEEIIAIKMWRYYTDSRIYYGTIVQVSEDNVNYTDVFNYETDGTYSEMPYGKTIPLDSDISLVQQAESSSANELSCSVTMDNCTVGNTLILAYAVRSIGNIPTLTDGWELVGGGNVASVPDSLCQKIYFAKKMVESATEIVTLTQTSTGRIYLICGEFSGDFSVVMRDDMANRGTSKYTVTADKSNSTDIMLYATTSAYYTTGRYQTSTPSDLIKLQGNADAERFACWFDNGSGALSHTFQTYIDTTSDNDAVVECVQFVPKKPKYLVRNNDIIYTVQNNSLVEVVGDLNAQLFIDNGVDAIPDGTLLMTLSNPEVLCWTDAETLPTLTATVKGMPQPQVIVSEEINLMDGSIKGIESVAIDCKGEPVFAVSFDKKASWIMHNGTDWVAVSDEAPGMTKTDFEAITTEQWQIKYEASSNMYIRCTLLDETQSLTSITLNFIN